MPNKEKELSNSFSDSYGCRVGPQATANDEPGYLKFTPQQASRLLTTAIKARNRQRKLKARRQRRWYHRKKAKLKAAGHPMRKPSAVDEILAVGLG